MGTLWAPNVMKDEGLFVADMTRHCENAEH